MLGIAHRNVGRFARTDVFEVRFRVMMDDEDHHHHGYDGDDVDDIELML